MGPVSRMATKKLSRVVGVPYVGDEGRGCCPRTDIIAREAVEGVVFVKGADDVSEIPAIRRFREGLRWYAKSAEGMYPEGPKVGGERYLE